MIKFQDMTPSVYYNQSRDFQFIGRLFDIMLNSVKTNTDMVNHVRTPNNTDERLLELYALTLGLHPKRKYSSNQLAAICSVFADIMRNKGSIKALQLAGNALIKAERIKPVGNDKQEFTYAIDSNNPTKIHLFFPQDFTDFTLFNDLLDYILPAGMTCDITSTLISTASADTKVNISMRHEQILYKNMDPANNVYSIPGVDMTLSDAALTSVRTDGTTDARRELYMNTSIWQPEDVINDETDEGEENNG